MHKEMNRVEDVSSRRGVRCLSQHRLPDHERTEVDASSLEPIVTGFEQSMDIVASEDLLREEGREGGFTGQPFAPISSSFDSQELK